MTKSNGLCGDFIDWVDSEEFMDIKSRRRNPMLFSLLTARLNEIRFLNEKRRRNWLSLVCNFVFVSLTYHCYSLLEGQFYISCRPAVARLLLSSIFSIKAFLFLVAVLSGFKESLNLNCDILQTLFYRWQKFDKEIEKFCRWCQELKTIF